MHYKRSKDYDKTGLIDVVSEKEYKKEMDKIERIAKEKIEVILNKKHTNSVDFILEQSEHNTAIALMKENSKTIDTFKQRVKNYLMRL